MATIQDSAKSREVAVRENREGVTDLRAAIKASEGQFALALPRHVDAGRFMRCALTAIWRPRPVWSASARRSPVHSCAKMHCRTNRTVAPAPRW